MVTAATLRRYREVSSSSVLREERGRLTCGKENASSHPFFRGECEAASSTALPPLLPLGLLRNAGQVEIAGPVTAHLPQQPLQVGLGNGSKASETSAAGKEGLANRFKEFEGLSPQADFLLGGFVHAAPVGGLS